MTKNLRKRKIQKDPPLVADLNSFVFTAENERQVKEILKRYPEGHQASAILPLFDLAQRQCGGWLPKSAIEKVTEMLGVSLIRGYEVATFYTMFNLEPIGRYHVQICGTTPCMLRGSDDLKQACARHLNIRCGETTQDGLFTMREVECIGACVNAPVVQINEVYYEDLTEEKLISILKDLAKGQKVKPGSVLGRQGAAPLGKGTEC